MSETDTIEYLRKMLGWSGNEGSRHRDAAIAALQACAKIKERCFARRLSGVIDTEFIEELLP